MKKGVDKSPAYVTPARRSNMLFDILLTGLNVGGELNKATLDTLSKVSKLFKGRVDQSYTKELTLSDEDKQAMGLSAAELFKINDTVDRLGCEMPSHQPSSDSQWEYYTNVPKDIKKSLIALYPKTGPELLTYSLALCEPASNELNFLRSWLEALEALYQSGNDQTTPFHGLFLNNHDFAKRAYHLAKETEIHFSTTVLRALTDCRFSSLTMNSLQLTELFTKLATFYKEHQVEDRQYSRTWGEFTLDLTQEDVQTFIKKNDELPKALLWRSSKVVDVPSPVGSPGLPLSLEDEPEASELNKKRKRSNSSSPAL